MSRLPALTFLIWDAKINCAHAERTSRARAPPYKFWRVISPRKFKNAMPTPIIPNAVKVTISGSLFGQLVENVWTVQSGDPPTDADLTTIIDEFLLDYPNITANLSAALTYTNIVARYMGDPAGPELAQAISPAIAGGLELDSAPGNVAICVSLKTALAGRRFRGRKFFSGIPKNSLIDNTMDATQAEGVRFACQTLINGLVTAGFPMTIVSLTGMTNVLVTNATLTDNFIDSQRRRLTGRGK